MRSRKEMTALGLLVLTYQMNIHCCLSGLPVKSFYENSMRHSKQEKQNSLARDPPTATIHSILRATLPDLALREEMVTALS